MKYFLQGRTWTRWREPDYEHHSWWILKSWDRLAAFKGSGFEEGNYILTDLVSVLLVPGLFAVHVNFYDTQEAGEKYGEVQYYEKDMKKEASVC